MCKVWGTMVKPKFIDFNSLQKGDLIYYESVFGWTKRFLGIIVKIRENEFDFFLLKDETNIRPMSPSKIYKIAPSKNQRKIQKLN